MGRWWACETESPVLQDRGRIQNDTFGTKLPAIRKPYLTKFHSKTARCFCQQMSRNSRIAIEGLRRLYHEKLASDFPNVHAGRLTETTRPPTKNSSKILQKSSVRTVRLRCRIPTPTSCPWRLRRRITIARDILVHQLRGK